ncbi:hypothetical protein TNIN_131781 [Trichonephila inaurata madagascariensis]|uniref:Uncharacterized protein n=1 Tax=Trichonephila inaurata madagascariensis TaxID=2747483 RepID=A0A8X6YRT3_9ARAC|nr:hypothetical protein TNIN_131781 [Trichonephila inaurata madagascariensis]
MNRHVNTQESLKSESVSTYSSDQPTVLPTLGHVSHTVAFIGEVVYLKMALLRSIFMDGLTPASRTQLGTVWKEQGLARARHEKTYDWSPYLVNTSGHCVFKFVSEDW